MLGDGTMKILIDENNVIKAWQVVGGGWGDTQYLTTVEVDSIPEEVKENCEKYCYINGEYIDNPDYVEPIDDSVDYDEIILDHEYRISMIELGV